MFLGGDDRLEVDVEAVGEAQGLAGGEVGGDEAVVDVGLHFVGQGDDDQVGLLHGFVDGHRLEAGFDGEAVIGAAFTLCDNDLHARIAEILGMGVAL